MLLNRVCKVFGSVFMLRSVQLVFPNKSPMRHSLANIAKRDGIYPGVPHRMPACLQRSAGFCFCKSHIRAMTFSVSPLCCL